MEYADDSQDIELLASSESDFIPRRKVIHLLGYFNQNLFSQM